MSIKQRLIKLELGKESVGIVLIAVNNGESNEDAYQRCFADGCIQLKQVLYVSPLDMLI